MTIFDHDLVTRVGQPIVVRREMDDTEIDTTKRGIYRIAIKRGLDVLLVILSMPVVLPLILFLAVLIRCDGGPSFYNQPRVGRGGHIYTMWKLRSMVPDADNRLEEYLAANPIARTEWEVTQKLKHDPRITRFGRFLRRSSLDELPQLWNVLIGDMSLVGPRPIMPCQQVLYPGSAYYRLRPGVTGPWQVSARNESHFSIRAIFDTAYEQDLSLATDASLILRTLQVVIRATGH